MQEKTDRNTVMHIRVPKDLAAQIKEVSKKENIAVGTALKFLLEQSANDKIESRLIKIEQKIGKRLDINELKQIRKSIQVIARQFIHHLDINPGHIMHPDLERIAEIKRPEKAGIKKGKASKGHIT